MNDGTDPKSQDAQHAYVACKTGAFKPDQGPLPPLDNPRVALSVEEAVEKGLLQVVEIASPGPAPQSAEVPNSPQNQPFSAEDEEIPLFVVGETTQGPIGPAQKIESFAQFEAAFGKLDRLSPENVRGLIVRECRALEELLLEKNAGYGNSALDPVRLFSRASPIEQLKVRIDDKLSRISRGDFSKVKEEDLKVVTKDLLGYLILIRVAWRLGLE